MLTSIEQPSVKIVPHESYPALQPAESPYEGGLSEEIVPYESSLCPQLSYPSCEEQLSEEIVPYENLPYEMPTTEQLVDELDGYVSSTGLESFYTCEDPFVQTLAQNAAKLKDDPNSFPRTPENLKRLTTLSLYEPVIYCDDSGSMEGSRFSDQADIAARIARVATMIVPDNLGVELRFINNHAASAHTTAAEIIEKLKNTRPRGNTRIGTTLRKTILEPLVYSRIDRNQPFQRPLLICTITDGAPSGEHESTFKNVIVECKQKLERKGYNPTSVRFCVSQIGNDRSAEGFMERLRNEKILKEVLYCTTDRMDEKFRALRENESKLEEWLLGVLANPILMI